MHPLRREITATALVNGLVNRAGVTFVFRLQEETGSSPPDIVRAHEAAKECGLPLIIGSFFRLSGDARLVLLAPDQQALSGGAAGAQPMGQY